MAIFKVKAGTLEGKILQRHIEAATREALLTKLEREGLFPISVSRKGFSFPALKRAGRVKSGEFLVFNYGLFTLLKAGLPVLDSLETLMKRSRNARLSSALADAAREIRNGQTLSEAMRKNPSVFPGMYTASIAAGERTGDLVPSIKGYIEFQKRTEAIRKKIVSAAIYPAVLAAASMAVIGFLISYVVPSFAKIYMDTGGDLPLPTRILINLAWFLKSHLLLILALAASAAFVLRRAYRSGAASRHIDGIKLRIPEASGIYRGYAIAKFARTLGMVMKSGIQLIEGLDMSKGVLNNVVLEEKLSRVIRKTREGESVTEAISSEGLLPDITLRMFSVGEKSASLPGILEEIADFHEQEVSHRVGILTDLLEPALMIIMGLIIGAIVVLMYLPIFQLGSRL